MFLVDIIPRAPSTLLHTPLLFLHLYFLPPILLSSFFVLLRGTFPRPQGWFFGGSFLCLILPRPAVGRCHPSVLFKSGLPFFYPLTRVPSIPCRSWADSGGTVDLTICSEPGAAPAPVLSQFCSDERHGGDLLLLWDIFFLLTRSRPRPTFGAFFFPLPGLFGAHLTISFFFFLFCLLWVSTVSFFSLPWFHNLFFAVGYFTGPAHSFYAYGVQ